jgi:hypothetical protein
MADGTPTPWRSWVRDSLLVFFAAAILVAPLWRVKYVDVWQSIESIFISDARFVRDHGFTANWQPDWYCGTRAGYIYPPALRYGTAVIALWPNMSTARAYHIYIAFFYCLGIAAVYLLARAGTGDRRSGLWAAAASALLSPSFLFLPAIRADAAYYVPQRLGALARYGEGPHISSMAWLAIALACSWVGLRRGRNGWLAASAAASSMVVATNFYGATALVLFYAAMVWALWVTEQDHFIWLRAAAAGVLAYGLTAFWLVPSYITLTLRNMQFVSSPPAPWSKWAALLGAAAFCLATWRWARGRSDRAWALFVIASSTAFSVNVLGNAWFGFRVLGEPGRHVPELDLCLILLLLLVGRQLWSNPRIPRWAFAAPALLAFWPVVNYTSHAWTYFPRADHLGRIEYQVTKWIHENLPGKRVMATGSTRFWYNAWFDGPMVGGGSEQGLMNVLSVAALFQTKEAVDPQIPIGWLQAMGADAFVVHDQSSMEIYKDVPKPERFEKLLRIFYDNGGGDRVYEVPRRFPGLARVVDTAQMDALPPMPPPGSNEHLPFYLQVLENGPASPAEFRQESPDKIRVRASLAQGQSLVVEETYDPNWSARSGGKDLPVREGPLHFMRIEAPPGEHDIEMEFRLPLENKVGRVVSALSVVALLALVLRKR